MVTLRTCVAVLLMSGVTGACAGGFSNPCPGGQDLREERYDATRIQSRGCVGQDSERNYRRQGLWEWFYQNGQKQMERTYRDGKMEGLYTRWYENGMKSRESTFRDGKEEGLQTQWYENGQKSWEVMFRDGKEEGLGTAWRTNGQKMREETYLNGILQRR